MRLGTPLNRGLYAAFILVAGALCARATEITGIVSDAKSQTLLPGASVMIVEDGRVAIADQQGRFRFSGVDEGSYTLRTSFIGYESSSEMVAVPASGNIAVSVRMGEQIVQLEKLVVEGYREGRAKALQQKRTSQSLVDIVSADSVGNLPDRNVADALSRLPGISIVADNGEGRFVTIRGADANLNAVTVNGATVAAPGVDGRSGRAMPLDVISSAQISQIEVVKTLTPDMDGTGIGGAINIRSTSAFDRATRFISGSVAVGYSDFANDNIYEGDVTFADRFGADKKVGIALSGSYSLRPFRTEAVQSDWAVRSANGVSLIVPDSIQLLPEDAERERIGFNGNFEYRPSDDLQLYVRTIYNEFNEENYRQEVANSQNGNLTILSDHSVRWGSARAERRAFYNPRNQTLFNISGGAVYHRNSLTVTPELTYSFAQEKQHSGFNTGQFRGGNSSAGPMTLDWGNDFQMDFFTTSTQYADPTQYPLRRFSYEYSTVQEDTYTPKVDFKWDLNHFLGGTGSVKIGAKVNSRTRYVHDNSTRYVAGSINPTIATTGAATATGQSLLGKYNTVFDLDYFTMRDWVAANLSGLVYDADGSSQNNAEDTYDLTEDIYAGYAMATTTWGKFTLLGGARYEYTDATISGKEYRSFGGVFQGLYDNVGSFDYDNLMPNLQGRYAFSKNLVGRASFTSTVGRPRYEYMSPKSSLVYQTDTVAPTPGYPNTGELTIGNPDLQAFESNNFDVSLDYYLNSGGILSIAGFYKDIKNPIYRFSDTQRNVTYNGLNFEELDTQIYQNADSGKVKGVELNMQLPFTFLPGFLNGFGVDANYTFVESEVTVPDRTGLPFFEQPDESANIALYFQKYGFQARVAWNYQSESLRELRPLFVLNGVAQPGDYYRADRYSIDAQASYKITENFRIFVNGQNLTNQAQDTYSGAKYRLRYSREFGYNVRGGIQFIF